MFALYLMNGYCYFALIIISKGYLSIFQQSSKNPSNAQYFDSFFVQPFFILLAE